MSTNTLNALSSSQSEINLNEISSNSDSGYISNGDDALAYVNQAILEYFRSFAHYLHDKFSSKNGLYERISRISGLYAHLISEKNKTLSDVTVDELKEASDSPDGLAKLFNSADYYLADSMENSESVLSDLNSLGLNIPTTKEFPVYAKVYDKEKRLVSEGTYFINESLRKLLSDNFVAEPSKEFPAANVVTIDISDSGKYEFTIFDQNANLKINEADLAAAIPKCEIFLNDLMNGVSEFLKKSLDSINSLKSSQDQINEIFKSDKKILDGVALNKISEMTDLLKNIRILFHERRFIELVRDEISINNSEERSSELNSNEIYKNSIYKIFQPEATKEEDSMEKNNILKKILAESKLKFSF